MNSTLQLVSYSFVIFNNEFYFTMPVNFLPQLNYFLFSFSLQDIKLNNFLTISSLKDIKQVLKTYIQIKF